MIQSLDACVSPPNDSDLRGDPSNKSSELVIKPNYMKRRRAAGVSTNGAGVRSGAVGEQRPRTSRALVVLGRVVAATTNHGQSRAAAWCGQAPLRCGRKAQ